MSVKEQIKYNENPEYYIDWVGWLSGLNGVYQKKHYIFISSWTRDMGPIVFNSLSNRTFCSFYGKRELYAGYQKWYITIDESPRIPPMHYVLQEQALQRKKLINALEQEYFLKPPGVDPRPVFKFGGPWVITRSEWEQIDCQMKARASEP